MVGVKCETGETVKKIHRCPNERKERETGRAWRKATGDGGRGWTFAATS